MHTKFLYRIFKLVCLSKTLIQESIASVFQNVSVKKKKKTFQIGVLLLMNEDPQLVPHLTQKTINTGEGSGKEDEKKWEKIFASYTSDRDLMPRIYKEFKRTET